MDEWYVGCRPRLNATSCLIERSPAKQRYLARPVQAGAAGSGPSSVRRLRLVQWCHPICQVQQHDPCGAEHIGALRAAEENLIPTAEAGEDGGHVLELPSTWLPSRQSVEEWNARREEEFAALHDDEVAEKRLFLGLTGTVLGRQAWSIRSIGGRVGSSLSCCPMIGSIPVPLGWTKF
jgi:hypothetical protein